MTSPKWFCAQIGAREHYAVARALQQKQRLAALYTDFWADSLVRRLAHGKLRSLAARWHPELDKRKIGAKVIAWNLPALFWEKRRRKINTRQTPYHGFIEVGQQFANRVLNDLQRRKEFGPDSLFYGYDTGALEVLVWCRKQGIPSVLNQMDPNRVEMEMVREEEQQWPGWALQPVRVPEEYFARRQQEWTQADCIVVNSDFSRQALVQQGVPPEKLVVIPLCFEASDLNQTPAVRNRGTNETLRVLFLGQVILRKGIQYLLAAAKLLDRANIRFDVVGPVGISRAAVASAPANVTFHGRTGRDQAAVWYQRAHVFILPTLSDGFAITQLEAMAHGLPVVTTPCCGEVVTDGVDGFVVPARDAEALAHAFQRYLAEPELLASQSAAAIVKVGQFGVARLAENLVQLETGLV